MKSLYQRLDLTLLVFLLFLLAIHQTLVLFDPDYFWHLETGRYIVEKKQIPTQDIFSFTFLNQPWVLHEWLFEVMLHYVHTLSGEVGVKLLTIGLVGLTILINYRTLTRLTHHPKLCTYLILLMLFLFLPTISPRPQLITFVFFSTYLAVLMLYVQQKSIKYLWTLPVIMVVWVNAHAGFITGIVMLGLFIGSLFVEQSLFNQHQRPEEQSHFKTLKLTALWVILATLVNPNTYMIWVYPFAVINLESSKNFITEWFSPNFHVMQNQVFLTLVMFSFIALLIRKNKPSLSEVVVTAFFTMMGFIAVRHIPLAVITLVYFLASTLSQLDFSIWHPLKDKPYFSSIYQSMHAPKKHIGKIEYALNWTILLAVLVALYCYQPQLHARAERVKNEFLPIAATEFLRTHHITGNLFNAYQHGGYLIRQLYPAQKVFIDGRADMYGDAYVKEYITMFNGLPGWKKSFAKYNIDVVLTTNDNALSELLLNTQTFALVFKDKHHSILLKKTDRWQPLINKYAITETP